MHTAVVLSGLFHRKMKKVPNFHQIVSDTVAKVCTANGVSEERLLSPERSRPIAMARFMVYYILCKHYKLPYLQAAKALGRTHASVLHGIEVVEYWLNPGIRDWDSKHNGETLMQIITELKQCVH